MSQRDFLRKQLEGRPEGPSSDYAFAHVHVRQLALTRPLQFLSIAVSPQAPALVEDIITDVTAMCGRPPTFPASAVKFHPMRLRGFPLLVIELPEARHVAEAHMVALLVLGDFTAGKPPALETIKARYFTLEKGLSLDSTPRTVLAEWDESSHSNYGEGPPVDLRAFVAALERFLPPQAESRQ